MAENEQDKTDHERLVLIENEVGYVKTSIQEVYRYLRDEFSKIIQLQLQHLKTSQLESKKDIEALKVKIETKASADDVSSLKKRVGAIEKWMWKAAGAIVILSFFAPYLLSLLGIGKK
jgi:hypothetical protein